MTEIVLFHSVLGVRQGVDDAVQRFWDAGHTVHVVDLYDGRSFDDYTEAGAYVESFGGPAALLGRTATAIEKLPSDVVYAGFSNGGGSALFAAGTRPGARGVLAFHAALPPAMFGVENWPGDVPVQVHYAELDPLRNQEWVDQLAAAVRASGAGYEFHDYRGVAGHLFTDASLPDEYDKAAAELLYERALGFLERV
jgi:dienelactone hydrolase